MRKAVREDLSKSAKAFQEVVWPQIESWFNGGKLEPVEAVTADRMEKHLDILAGIDAWHIKTNIGVRGLASRVQKPNARTNMDDFPYNTFTVRKSRESGMETEFQKRLRALKSDEGWLYPEVTIQAYVNDQDKLLTVAGCRTEDLIFYIRDHEPYIETNRARDRETGERATFYTVYWWELRDNDIDFNLRKFNEKANSYTTQIQLGLF